MRNRVRALLVTAALAGSVFVALPVASASNIGTEGCTPGYWKNHTSNWQEYTPGQVLDVPFDFPDTLASYRTVTLQDALSLRGGRGVDGATQILLRASTAAILNAAHEGLGYPYRRFSQPFSIIEQVNAALASGDRATMLALATELDEANNLGCPLS